MNSKDIVNAAQNNRTLYYGTSTDKPKNMGRMHGSAQYTGTKAKLVEQALVVHGRPSGDTFTG